MRIDNLDLLIKTITQQAQLTVITGSMFSGKTTTLIELLTNLPNSICFKPKTDTRSLNKQINSRNNTYFNAIAIESALDISRHIDNNVEFIGIDEAQFFEDDILLVASNLISEGYSVIVSGLLTDYRNRLFGFMPELTAMAMLDGLLFLCYAKCTICGGEAMYTFRKGKSEKLVEVGSNEYEPRCGKHHPDLFLVANCMSPNVLD